MKNPQKKPKAGVKQDGSNSAGYEQQIIDASPIGTLITRISDGTILYANKAIGDLLRIQDVKPIIGTPVPNFYWDSEERSTVVSRFRAEGFLNGYEMRARRADNSMFWVSMSLRPFQFEGETTLLSTITDITERKQIEETLYKANNELQAVLDAATQESIIAADPNGVITVFNTGAERMLGYLAEELVGKQTPAILHLESEVVARGKELSAEFGRPIEGFDIFVEYARQGRYEERNWTYVRKDGVHLTVSLVVTALRDSAGNITGFLGVARDITERQKTEAALRESEERFRAIYDNATIGLYRTTPDGRLLMINPTGVRMMGYDSFDEIAKLDVEKAGYEQEGARNEFREKIESEGYVVDFENKWKRKDGSTIFVRESAKTIRDENGKVLYYDGSFEDITERKQAEEELQRLASVVQNSSELVNLATLDGKMIFLNEAGSRMLGITPAEVTQHTVMEVIPEQWLGMVQSELLPTVMEKGRWEGDLQYRNIQTDAVTDVHALAFMIKDAKTGAPLYLANVSLDITERKRAEQSLHESEQRFRTVADFTYDWEYWLDRDGKFQYVSPACKRISGYTAEEFEQDPTLLSKIIHPDDHAAWEEHVRSYHTERSEKIGELNMRIINREGEARWIGHVCQAVHDDNGEWQGRRASNRDITERKQAEEELHVKDRALASSLSGISINILDGSSPFGKPIFINDSFLKMFGYTLEEAMQLTPSDIAPTSQEAERVLTAIQTQGFFSGELVAKRKDGSLFPTQNSSSLVMSPAGQPIAMLSTWIDVTERKQAEEELQKLASVVQNSSELVNLSTLDGKMIFLNEAGSRMLGVDPSELAQHTIMEVIPEGWLGMVQSELLPTVMEKGRWEGDLQYRNIQTNALTDVHALAFVIKDAKTGAPLYLANVSLDVTERKQAEEELQKLASVVQYSSELVNLSTLDGKMIFLNEAGSRMLGIAPTELGQHTIMEVIPEGWLGMVQSELLPTVMEKGRWEGDLQYRNIQTNTVTDVHALAFVIKDAKTGAPLYLANVSLDITERKRLEREVQEAFERRGYQVQISTEISQEVAAASELGDLFGRVVTLTKERLGYYHTQLLRYDPAQDAVVLVNGYGEIGQTMLAGGHKLPMGSGLIGTAAASGQTVMRSTLAEDPDWRPNPLLPETKGEIAVPIKWQDAVLGVLDVQSNQAGALTEDDRLLLEGLCGQVAVAMEQTRLRQEMAERLEEVNRLYRTMSREGWQTYRETADLPVGFIYDQAGIKPVDEAVLAGESFSNIPMKVLGGEVVGTLAVADDPRHPISPEDQTFLQQVSDQIALALESARLFGQTQSALAQTERLSEAGLRFARSANLQELLAVVNETLGIPVINRAVLGAFNYSSTNELESMDILANWWSGSGLEPTPIGTHYPVETLHAMSFFLSTTPVFFSDMFTDERAASALEFFKQQKMRCAAALPLYLGTRHVGVLFLEAEEIHNFTQDETRLLTAMAPQIATVLENRRQFERAQKQAERESTLNIISQKIQSATTVEAVLQIAARELGHALGAPMTIAQLSMKDKK